MARLTMETYIEAPRELVFDTALDLRSVAENIRGIQELEVLTDGPIGVGTRFRETRILFRREATEVMEITTCDRPARARPAKPRPRLGTRCSRRAGD